MTSTLLACASSGSHIKIWKISKQAQEMARNACARVCIHLGNEIPLSIFVVSLSLAVYCTYCCRSCMLFMCRVVRLTLCRCHYYYYARRFIYVTIFDYCCVSVCAAVSSHFHHWFCREVLVFLPSPLLSILLWSESTAHPPTVPITTRQ